MIQIVTTELWQNGCFLQALNSQSQRLNLVQELFADIALEVDVRARGKHILDSAFFFVFD